MPAVIGFDMAECAAVQIAAMRANNYALERDTPGFRHWAQVIKELNAMIQVTPDPTLL